jgi:hypothetical protein
MLLFRDQNKLEKHIMKHIIKDSSDISNKNLAKTLIFVFHRLL